jgi:hypothetical protein
MLNDDDPTIVCEHAPGFGKERFTLRRFTKLVGGH